MDAALAFAEIVKEGAKSKPLAERQAQEIDLWWDWKNSGQDPEKMQPLLDSYGNLLGQRIRMFQGRVSLPPAAVENEFHTHFLKAMRTFDPDRGVRLGTYVHHHLRGAQRYINKYQNVGRIPETRIYKITEFKTAKSDMDEKLGRPPTDLELADHLGWNSDEVRRMDIELSHSDLVASTFLEDPTIVMPSREKELVRLLRYELTPEETVVYDHLLGTGGKRGLSATQIAKKMKWSDSKVSRLRKKVAGKAQKYGLV